MYFLSGHMRAWDRGCAITLQSCLNQNQISKQVKRTRNNDSLCCDILRSLKVEHFEKTKAAQKKKTTQYRTRANRPPTVYLLNQFFGPDFEISDCKNA